MRCDQLLRPVEGADAVGLGDRLAIGEGEGVPLGSLRRAIENTEGRRNTKWSLRSPEVEVLCAEYPGGHSSPGETPYLSPVLSEGLV